MSGADLGDAIGFEILRSLRRILRRVSRHSKELTRDVGLSVPQLTCLKAVAESEATQVTVGEISKKVSLSAPTTSRILDRMVRKGLIERHRWETDRRKVYLVLTTAGRAIYRTLPPPLDERFLERLATMPQSERFQLLAALERIVELMDAGTEDAAPMLVDGVDVDEDEDV